MPVTELALIHLKPGTTIESPTLRKSLRKAKIGMETFTGHKFYFLHQVEDPSYIYILGEWDSVKQHLEDWIPSIENQQLLETLKDDIEVEWLSHFDVAITKIQLDSPVLSIGRHMIKKGEKVDFENCFQDKRKYLDTFVTNGQAVGGWKVDDVIDVEEFVLFAPWNEVQQHMDFAKDEGFKEYATIRGFISKADIKHVKVVEL